MLDHFHLPTANGNAEIFSFVGTIAATGDVGLFTWQKPRGKSMIDILLVGVGGAGGNGAVGANSTASSGGGGGSGGQTRLTMPLHLLPDQLYIQLPAISQGTGTRISIYPDTTANNTLMVANGGSNGGNASGATAGTAGGGGGAATAGTMPLGWAWSTVLAGQSGTVITTSAGALTIPTTGLVVTGGTAGGALPAAATAGQAGGSFTVAGVFPAHAGGASQATSTSPGNPGAHGYRPVSGLLYGYGGTGGSSSHGSATGAGLFGGNGGNAAPGCGGGGGGGCLTGGTAGVGGKGGPAFCIITCW